MGLRTLCYPLLGFLVMTSVRGSDTVDHAVINNTHIESAACWTCPVKFNHIADSESPMRTFLTGLTLTAIFAAGCFVIVLLGIALYRCKAHLSPTKNKYGRLYSINIASSTNKMEIV